MTAARCRTTLMCAVLTLLGPACTSPATEIFLSVSSDLATLGNIRVRTWNVADTTQQGATATPCSCVGPSCRPVPFTLGLIPADDRRRRFVIEVAGYPAEDRTCQTPLLKQTAVVQFVPNVTLNLYMDLASKCLGVTCPTEQTCSDGQCVRSEPVAPGPVPPAADGGGAATTDGGAVPQGIDMAGGFIDPCGCSSACFVAGTPVRVGDAHRSIEQLVPGDRVSSLDDRLPLSTGALPLGSVRHTMGRMVDEVLELHVAGEVVTTTAEHPFAVWDHGFVRAGELAPGAPLRRADGQIAPLERVVRRRGAFQVFNVEVDAYHTYFVSKLDLLVHNKTLCVCPQD